MVITGIDGGVAGINGVSSMFPSPGAKETNASSNGAGFTQVLKDTMNRVNDLQVKSDKAVQDFVTGDARGLHEVMIAMEKSSISFQFLTQVRNKVVDAYNEVMRMPV
jgi:flagellar hook-basal body complex protein FliE